MLADLFWDWSITQWDGGRVKQEFNLFCGLISMRMLPDRPTFEVLHPIVVVVES